MSEKYKLKYEVVAILKENIQKGLESFGLPLSETPGDGGWICMEGDQPAFRNADKAVLFFCEKVERIGWQSARDVYNREKDNFDVIEYFIEQQIWQIKVICKRSTAPVTDEDIPLTTEDVASMLIAWFNRMGCQEFRKHNMANLFVQLKDVKSYKSASDVSQWTTEFPLKLQVIKQFETEIGTAVPEYGGSIPIEGEARGRLVRPKDDGSRDTMKKIKGIFGRLKKAVGL